MKYVTRYFLIFILLISTRPLLSQVFDEKFEHWPIDLKINGTIIAANKLIDADETDSLFFRVSEGVDANILVIFLSKPDLKREEAIRDHIDNVKSLHLVTADLKIKQLPKDIVKELKEATGVILISGNSLHENAKHQVTSIKKEIKDLISRGGALYTEGAVSRLLSTHVVSKDKSPDVVPGLNLIPDSIIETSFSKPSDLQRIKAILKSHPRQIGIGIEKDAAIVLSGRKLGVLGNGKATVIMAANDRKPVKTQKLAKRSSTKTKFQRVSD